MDDKHSSSGGTGTGTGDLELYQSSDGLIQLEVHADGDTVWLTRQQMATLFGRDVKTIGKHVTNAKREELKDIPTVAKFATVQREGDRLVEREVEHYNLDMILSVGYRVKSDEGVKFRQWANNVLRRYVMKGVAVNQHRLEQIGHVVRILRLSSDQLISGTADVLSTYLPSLELLRDYDAGATPPLRHPKQPFSVIPISASPSSQSALLRHPNQRFSVIPISASPSSQSALLRHPNQRFSVIPISASPSSQSALLRHPNQRFSVIPISASPSSQSALLRHLERSREISAVGIQ